MADVSLARTAIIFRAQKVSFCAMKITFCALKMLVVLANETSAIMQFRLTQFSWYISPEERAAVEVLNNIVPAKLATRRTY